MTEDFQRAATLAALFAQDGETHVILTKRTDKVKHHKGQICLPGGVHDPDDATLWDTALRETAEEIGIESHCISYIDALPEVTTPTGFLVTPYVGWVASTKNLTPNPDEIDQVFSVPVGQLMRPDILHFEEHDYFGGKRRVPFFTYGDKVIWGATGFMLLSLVGRWNDISRIIGGRVPGFTLGVRHDEK